MYIVSELPKEKCWDILHNGSIVTTATGETPLDCAPASLQYKIREKMGEEWTRRKQQPTSPGR